MNSAKEYQKKGSKNRDILFQNVLMKDLIDSKNCTDGCLIDPII